MEKADIMDLALQLCKNDRLTLRQYEIWTRVFDGETIRTIHESKTLTGAVRTLYREFKAARKVMSCAVEETEGGTIRYGLTVENGHDPRWKPDRTMQRRQMDQESNWPYEALQSANARKMR